MFKTKEIYMLPTSDVSDVFLIGLWEKLFHKYENLLNLPLKKYESYQHLYVVDCDCEEELKSGDWIYWGKQTYSNNGYDKFFGVYKLTDEVGGLCVEIPKELAGTEYNLLLKLDYNISINDCKKVIASTDKSLGVNLIPDDFVIKFTTEYNNGVPIKYVKVGYDLLYFNKNLYWQPFPDEQPEHKTKYVLTVYYPTKTINIEPVKEFYTREEAIEIARKAFDEGGSDDGDIEYFICDNFL